MTKHSRNNTASSVFTYAERGKLGTYYGTKKQRLGTESMRTFDSCSLCLQRARDPVACTRGHIYCKECIYSDLLSQRKEIKRYQAKLDALAREEEEERDNAKNRARERVVADFEKNQLGLGVKRKETEGSSKPDASLEASRGIKRKFSVFDQKTVDKLAEEAEEAALRQIEAEQAEARRAKLPDFWLPSLTPEAAPGRLMDIKLQTLCHQSHPSHPMNMKSLIPVIFTFDKDSSSTQSSDTRRAICPSCKKELANPTHLNLLRPCSHVLCRTCTDTLVKPSSQCSVCDTVLKEPKKDIIDMEREGTGFSAGGMAETSRVGVAFQG